MLPSMRLKRRLVVLAMVKRGFRIMLFSNPEEPLSRTYSTDLSRQNSKSEPVDGYVPASKTPARDRKAAASFLERVRSAFGKRALFGDGDLHGAHQVLPNGANDVGAAG